MNRNRNQQSGFTMIEIMVVVVIVAILAVIALPTYLNYVKSSYASEARTVMSNINNAAKMYYQIKGQWPSEVEELERSGQLDVSRSTKLKWAFDIQLSDQGGRITATSTEEMSGGPGHQIVYEPHFGIFTGYGTPPPQEKKKKKKKSKSKDKKECSSSGAKSFAQERAKYGLSKINKTSSLNMEKISSLGYDRDWGYLIEGINNYGSVTFITVLISCSNGQYSVDFVESS